MADNELPKPYCVKSISEGGGVLGLYEDEYLVAEVLWVKVEPPDDHAYRMAAAHTMQAALDRVHTLLEAVRGDDEDDVWAVKNALSLVEAALAAAKPPTNEGTAEQAGIGGSL
jgi:hypothetical protein